MNDSGATNAVTDNSIICNKCNASHSPLGLGNLLLQEEVHGKVIIKTHGALGEAKVLQPRGHQLIVIQPQSTFWG